MTHRIWHPAPRGLIIAAATERWTRQQPAPDLVVYLWVWAQYDDSERPTRRQVARLFGWTEHDARKLLDRVKEDYAEWLVMTGPARRKGRRPPKASDDADLGDTIARNPPDSARISPAREGATTTQSQDNTLTLVQGTLYRGEVVHGE